MIRWQRALLEVRGLRQAILAGRDSFAYLDGQAIDEATLRQMRLDGFYRAVDRYEPSHGSDDLFRGVYNSTDRPLVHLDEVDARLDAATRNIDWLLNRYASPGNVQHAWFESIPTSVGYHQRLLARRNPPRHSTRFTRRSTAHLSRCLRDEVLRIAEVLALAAPANPIAPMVAMVN